MNRESVSENAIVVGVEIVVVIVVIAILVVVVVVVVIVVAVFVSTVAVVCISCRHCGSRLSSCRRRSRNNIQGGVTRSFFCSPNPIVIVSG